jgi:hypothetical protein
MSDAELAAAWVANERLYGGRGPDDHSVPVGYDMVVAGDVQSLILGDPIRGRDLIEAMLEIAESEDDLQRIGIGPLENLLREHGQALRPWVSESAESRLRFRYALGRCWPFESIQDIWKRLNSAKGRTHTYWTMGFRLRCEQEPSQRELLDAKLQEDVVGGATLIDAGDRIVYFDYWGRDRYDAEVIGERLLRTLVAALGRSACDVVGRVGPDLTWPGTRPGVDRPTRRAV